MQFFSKPKYVMKFFVGFQLIKGALQSHGEEFALQGAHHALHHRVRLKTTPVS